MKLKVLIFHTSLASYRIDFFNEIYRNFNAVFYFEQKKQLNHSFADYSPNLLENKCFFKPNYLLRGFKIFGRSIKFGIFRIINNENPDIVICYEYSPITIISFLHYLLKRKSYKMYTISDDSLENSKKRKGLRALVRWIVSRNIDGVIFTSKEVSSWFHNNISNKVKLLELPIIHDDKVFRFYLEKSIDIANQNIELFNLEDKKIILFVGRLIELKNLSFLMRSISQLDRDDWILVIVGEGEQLVKLKREARELNLMDKVIFTGNLEGKALHSWYVLAQLFILPSVFEQFGAVVNEALLAGCKVLCSDVAGAATLITEKNGVIFDPTDERNLILKINESLKNEKGLKKEISELRINKMPFTFEEIISQLFFDIA